ncbi:MAG: hypothetical protein ACI4JI_04745 [Ruminiclostridium sp.]
MEISTLKELIAKYGLPLDVKRGYWYGDYYFRAEKINQYGKVSGWIYKDGSLYQFRYFSEDEMMQPCHNFESINNEEANEQLQNPNGLDTNKNHYKKGMTKLFINKGGRVVAADFVSFDIRNGHDVIFVICEGDTKPGFYPFPNTTYIFPNKDDANRAIDRAKMLNIDNSTFSHTVAGFQSLPKAIKPSTSAVAETEHEKEYHRSVDQELQTMLSGPQIALEDGQQNLAEADYAYRQELIAAHENGFMPDEHTCILHHLNTEHAKNKISRAQEDISNIERKRKKPYFARIDCGKNALDLHTAYIGDYDIPGYVIDWRHADIGNAYYHSSMLINRDDVFLALKRIITINMGVFECYDDDINLYNGDEYTQNKIDHLSNSDALLTKLLAESRLDKSTHDIIKTIQSEQYEIITSDFTKNTVINGCAGSGKTMIMYHRLSYMAYNYESVLKRKFDPNRVYIVSPSSLFDLSNNELMRKLSIDKIRQAPFREQVENLIGEYCYEYGIVQLQGIANLIDANGTEEANFFSYNSFNHFLNKLEELDKDTNLLNEYNQWIIATINQILDLNGFKTIPDHLIPTELSDVNTLLSSSDYFLNECFLKKGAKTDAKIYYYPSAITTISYENILHALNLFDKNSNTYIKRHKLISKNIGMLKPSLSLKTKMDSADEVYTNLSELWNLMDNTTAFEKMLALLTVQRLFECMLVQNQNNYDYILKCLFIYQKYFTNQHTAGFSLYVLRAMSQKFGTIIKEDSLIFVDEFQNYSSFELECLKSTFAAPVFNLFGDYDQRIEAKGIDLKANIGSLFSPYTYNININYRNSRQITEYINKVIHKNMKPIGIDGNVEESTMSDCLFEINNRTAIICNNVKLAMTVIKKYIDPKLINNISSTGKLRGDKFALMTVYDCKGLEFDKVYVLNHGMTDNEKYVAYTRAMDYLVVITDDLDELCRQEDEAKRKKGEEDKQSTSDEKVQSMKKALGFRLNDVLRQIIAIRQTQEHSFKEETLQEVISQPSQEVQILNVPVQAVGNTPVEMRNNSPEVRNEPSTFADSLIDSAVSEEHITSKEQLLDDGLNRLAEYCEELKRRDAILSKAQQERNERIYKLATQKLQSDNPNQINEAIILFETIQDYEDAIELIANAKIRILSISEELEAKKISFRSQGLCQYCGGKFKGLFIKWCRNCGKKKDY